MKIQVKSLIEGWTGISAPAKQLDSGFDMIVSEDTIIPPHGTTPTNVPCGSCIKLPEGHHAVVITRSGANKRGIQALPGLIDEAYTGPLYAICYNHTDSEILVKKGERVAQLLIQNRITPELEWVEALPETERASSGFGSTGM